MVDKTYTHKAMTSNAGQSVKLSLAEAIPDLCFPKQLLPLTASCWKQNYHRLPVQLSPPGHFDYVDRCCFYKAAAPPLLHIYYDGDVFH